VAGSAAPLSATDLTGRLRARFGQDVVEASDALGQAWVRVVPERYRDVIAALRDDEDFACDYLYFVAGVDQGDDGFDVVAQLYSTIRRHQVRVKVAAGKEEPSAPTISDLYPGANWHERETWELFGIRFEGHPQLVKLVLPEQFEGHPLRKDFPLTSRLAKPWPGEEKAD
jgi:NADH-quinone oxidoreductase subunit C